MMKAIGASLTTILVIDDDAEIRGLFACVLRQAGYRVEAAENGRAGLEALHRLHAAGCPPHLIFLDLDMPEMNGAGFRAGQAAHPDLRTIPVVIVSGEADAPAQAAALGAAAWLRKPAGAVALLAAAGAARSGCCPN